MVPILLIGIILALHPTNASKIYTVEKSRLYAVGMGTVLMRSLHRFQRYVGIRYLLNFIVSQPLRTILHASEYVMFAFLIAE